MIVPTRAIVLNHFRYNDSSLITNLYTEALGKQTIFIQGAFKKKSAVRSVLFQPLYLIETEIHYRANRQMQRISDACIFKPLRYIPFDPVKSSIALFIAEILSKTLKEEEQNPELFKFLVHSIEMLDLNDAGTANFHLMFLLHYTRYLGFYPDTIHTFNLNNARMNRSEKAFPADEYDHLPRLFDLSFEHLGSMQVNRQQRNKITELLLSYYSDHVDNFGQVKSFPVLQNVFMD